MEFNLTTFILEMVNFLALVWILQRLFYAPVKRGLEERKKAVQKTLEDAETAKREAAELQAKYGNRLKDWEREKAGKQEAFRKEMEAQKDRELAQVRASVEQERGKLKAQEEKRLAELFENNEREALRQSAAFASRLLSQLATPETELRILDLALGRLSDKDEAQRLRAGVGSQAPALTVRSAYPLPGAKAQELCHALHQALRWNGPVQFVQDPGLLAGLEIDLGPVVFRANLRDELKYFSEAGLS